MLRRRTGGNCSTTDKGNMQNAIRKKGYTACGEKYSEESVDSLKYNRISLL